MLIHSHHHHSAEPGVDIALDKGAGTINDGAVVGLELRD
jgi:hypothetical protein